MDKAHNKGFALVEMIIVVALIAIVLPLLLQLYIFGQESFSYGSRLVAQQYTVTNTMQHIRGEVQSAAYVSAKSQNKEDDQVNDYPKSSMIKLGYYDEGSPPVINKCVYWRFYCEAAGKEGVLQRTTERNFSASVPDTEEFVDVVMGLDINKCNFVLQGSKPYKLTVEIKPVETNSGKAQARNVRESIITDISVLYKDIEIN